jgi:hypothetical protein
MEPQRIVIVSGHPTDLEVAAIAAALQRHRSTTTAAGHRKAINLPVPARVSRWALAARLEGRGHPPIDSPTSVTR